MIELINPVPKSIVSRGDSFLFNVDDTYTTLAVVIETASGDETAYDTASGGFQAGYTGTVVPDASSQHQYTIKRTAGWDKNPQVIRVTEDETGDTSVTEFSYDLSGELRFPKSAKPVVPSDTPVLTLQASGDDDTIYTGVTWIDLVSGTLPDGTDVSSTQDGQVTIEAFASTTDPDALHDNVAGEVSPLTEKASTAQSDSPIIMEDSEAGYVKKSVKARVFAGAPNPEKLDTTLGCQLLYTFEHDFTNSGPAGSSYDFVNFGSATPPFVPANAITTEAMQVGVGTEKANTSNLSVASSVSSVGEVTVQAVIRVYEGLAGSTNSQLIFSCHRQNTTNSETSWMLRARTATGSGTPLTPEFVYRNAADSASIRVMDTNFSLSAGMYHIAGRRVSDGGSGYDASLWVNGVKIAQLDSQVAAHAGGAAQRVKAGSDQFTTFPHAKDCCKQSNTALTDSQIVSEYKKALGLV